MAIIRAPVRAAEARKREVTQVPVGTVMSRLARGRRRPCDTGATA
jgi:hypothetical protein